MIKFNQYTYMMAAAWLLSSTAHSMVAMERAAMVAAPGQELASSAKRGDLNKLSALISASVNVNTTSQFGITTGNTPLALAVYFQRYEAARLLLGAGANVNIQNSCGGTALQMVYIDIAAPHKTVELVRGLIAAGANPHLHSRNTNETPVDAWKRVLLNGLLPAQSNDAVRQIINLLEEAERKFQR